MFLEREIEREREIYRERERERKREIEGKGCCCRADWGKKNITEREKRQRDEERPLKWIWEGRDRERPGNPRG